MSDDTAKTDNPSASKTNTVLSALVSIIKWLALFFVIYTLINWWRQPIMPEDGLDLTLTDYQGQRIELSTMSIIRHLSCYTFGALGAVSARFRHQK